MKSLNILCGAAALLMVAFFLYSFWIAPFSVQHGYYVGAAKLMAQGLIPFRDFNIMDMPLGIWIISLIYRIVGVNTSGNAAVILMMMVNAMNFFLIFLLLKRIHIQSTFRWFGLFFYVCILYSTKALMVNLEPLCVFFLLLSLLFVHNRTKVDYLCAALCFTLSALCEYHVLIMSPVLFLLVLLPIKSKKMHWKESLSFLGFFFIIFAIAFLIVMVICSESNIIRHFDLRISVLERVKNYLLYAVILGARCSLYFILPGVVSFGFVRKRTRVYTWLALFAYLLSVVLLLLHSDNAWGQFLYPFIIMAFASGMQDFTEKNKYYSLIYLSCLVIPGYLGLRDFQKLDYGDLKEEQSTYLEIVNETFQGTKTMAVFAYRCYDYEMASQVFSEVRNVHPSNLKNTQWGLNDWDLNQYDEATAAMKEANIIVMNKEFLYGVDSFDFFYLDKWTSELNELMDSHDAISIGDVSYIINN